MGPKKEKAPRITPERLLLQLPYEGKLVGYQRKP